MRQILAAAILGFGALSFSACDLKKLGAKDPDETKRSAAWDPSDPDNIPESARFAKPGPPGPDGQIARNGAGGQLMAAADQSNGLNSGSLEDASNKGSQIFDGARPQGEGSGQNGNPQGYMPGDNGQNVAGNGAQNGDGQGLRYGNGNGNGANGGADLAHEPRLTYASYTDNGDASRSVKTRSGFTFDEVDRVSAKSLPSKDEIGYLEFDDGSKKKLTQADLLWMARAIHGETSGSATEEQAAAMFWTLAQRMRWSPTFKQWSMAHLVQAFSQPVNPHWTADGSKCKGRSHEDECSPSRTRKRDKYRSLEWNEISPAARTIVTAFAQGKVDNHFVGLVDWFDRGMWEAGRYDQRHKPGNASVCGGDNEHEFSRLKIRGDAYIAVRCPGHERDTWDWKGGEVVAVGPDGRRSKAFRLDGVPSNRERSTLVASAQ
jgi:hypothetical protein